MFERIDSRADALSQVLGAVHLESALSARTELCAPWGLRFGAAERRAGFHVVVEGRCCVGLPGREPVALETGDVLLVPHGDAHWLADDPTSARADFAALADGLAPGERVGAPCGGGVRSVLLCGAYTFSADGHAPLLHGLPDLVRIPAEAGPLAAVVGLLVAEAERPGAGAGLVVGRLVDLLFVYALRTWLAGQGAAGDHSWLGALHDPAVGPALRAVHAEPERRWTVGLLAERTGLSRAAFSRRFGEAIGEPPLTYVTRWRMAVAADLLAEGERVAAVAARVGYQNEFAFAKAFKRVRGVPPGAHRRRHAA